MKGVAVASGGGGVHSGGWYTRVHSPRRAGDGGEARKEVGLAHREASCVRQRFGFGEPQMACEPRAVASCVF